jgi:hypothetical protein
VGTSSSAVRDTQNGTWLVEVLVLNNKVFSLNLFRLVHYEGYQFGGLIPHKRDRDVVAIIKSGRT